MAKDTDYGNINWQVPSAFPLRSIEGIMESFAMGRGLCVRRLGHRREVWKVQYGGEYFYVKRARYGLFERLAVFLGLKGLKNEFTKAPELKKKNVPAPEMLAYGVMLGKGLPTEEFIITKGVKNSQTLKDFFLSDFSARFSRREKKEFLRDFAAFFRAMHDRGVVHRDPHMGNILLRRDEGRYSFYLLDLRKVEIKPSLALRERWQNLVLLNLNFASTRENSLKFYFFKHYARGLVEDRKGLRDVIRRIERETRATLSRVFKKRVERCMRTNRVFEHTSLGAFEVYRKKGIPQVLGLDEVLSSPDRFLDGRGVRILKNGSAFKEGLIETGEGRFLLGRHNANGFFRTPFSRTHGGAIEWRKSYMAELRGLNMPRALAYMEERRGHVLKRSYIVKEFIDNGVRLSEFARAGLAAMGREERGEFLYSLGAEVGRMHTSGWLHRGLNWDNILVKNCGTGFYFLNAESGRAVRNAKVSDRAGDLAPFVRDMERSPLEGEEKMRFFEGYLKMGCRAVKNPEFSSMVEKALIRLKTA